MTAGLPGGMKLTRKYSDYYAEQLEVGLEFQDFVTRELYRRGIVVIGYASKKMQRSCGENMLGAEIKRDDNFRQTGNLYIETAEKSDPENLRYIESGVMRKDNAWLYVIGDEIWFYVFSIKCLRVLAGKKYRKVENGTKTSKGFLLPLSHAEFYCLRRIDANGEIEEFDGSDGSPQLKLF